MYGWYILSGIAKVSFETHYKISYPYTERYVFLYNIEILGAHTRLWNAPRQATTLYHNISFHLTSNWWLYWIVSFNIRNTESKASKWATISRNVSKSSLGTMLKDPGMKTELWQICFESDCHVFALQWCQHWVSIMSFDTNAQFLYHNSIWVFSHWNDEAVVRPCISF